MHLLFIVFICAVAALDCRAASAQRDHPEVSGVGPPDDPTRQKEENWVDDRWQKTDIGQFLAACIETPEQTHKGIAIKVGEKDDAAVCFDTELLHYTAGWSGGFLQVSPKRYGLIVAPKPKGTIEFKSRAEPGWAHNGSFADPRAKHLGNLPREWGHYHGLYQSGKRVVLAYRVNGVDVFDSPWLEKTPEAIAFTRTIEIGPTEKALQLRLCDTMNAELQELDGIRIGASRNESNCVAVAVSPGDAKLSISPSGSIEVQIGAHSQPTVLRAFIWRGPKARLQTFGALVKSSPPPTSLKSLTHGGPARWTQPVATKGSVGFGTGPLVIDTLTVPYENPWNALMFTSGHDFFANGDAAVCTAHGDVWRVSGIDEKLQKLNWKRFATGLYQPLGLKIVRDKVYVLGRDQITMLHDLNGDGEADYYENFNNDCLSAGTGHGYATCLETDAATNFYYLKCGENTPHGGSVLRVSADGQKLDVVASGFRNPNGMGMGPGDLLTVADQQGEWVPETRLDVIRPGGFYGYMPMHHRSVAPTIYDSPLCWIARAIDNSAGGEVWVPQGTWGAVGGQMLHLSYGRCTMMLILPDRENELAQAGIVPLPGRFLSGVMRGRFNPKDGQLYVDGLRGWQTAAVRDGCFQRVRYTGKPFFVPIGYAVRSNGIALTFSQPLERSSTENVDSYAIAQWNYRWSATYGSPDYSVEHPDQQGRDNVVVKSARLTADSCSVFLEIPDLRPAMEIKIAYNVKSADGKSLRSDFYGTVTKVPRGSDR
jgi:hypothetical protein